MKKLNNITIARTKKYWAYLATGSCALVGAVIIALSRPVAVMPALVFFLAAACAALPLRFGIQYTPNTIAVCNGILLHKIPTATVAKMHTRVRPNIASTLFAFRWAFRKKEWVLVLHNKKKIRALVFTEIRNNGKWESIGTVTAQEWASQNSIPIDIK